MFQSISWSQFFTAAGLGLGVYYAIATLFFYGEEIKAFFRNMPGAAKEKEKQDHQNNQDPRTKELRLVGVPKSERAAGDDGVINAGAEDLQFAPMDTVGSVADLGEEIKVIGEKLATTERKVAIAEFKTLLGKYSKLGATGYRSTINLLISETVKDHAEYRFGLKEIDAWWDQAK